MALKLIGFITLFFLTFASPALALKKRVWTGSSATSTVSTSPSASISMTNWKQNVSIRFYNLNLCQSVSYEITYLSNNLEQGIFGSVKASEGRSVSRSLFLGTCSKKVCVAHRNITNLYLTINYKLTSGQNIVKKYRIKI